MWPCLVPAGSQSTCRHTFKIVPFSEASEDSNGGGDTWLIHVYLLEAALKGRVLLNVLTVFVQSSGTNASQLTASQHGLQQVACTRRQLPGEQQASEMGRNHFTGQPGGNTANHAQ